MNDLPSWWSKESGLRSQNHRSARQERKVAKEVGGRVQAGSGSSWRAPEDIVSDTHMIQHKGTKADSYRVVLKEWKRIIKNARQAGKEPALIIEFEDGTKVLMTEFR